MDSVKDPVTPSNRSNGCQNVDSIRNKKQCDVTSHVSMQVPYDFSLEKAVVSYGFFMTAPNQWFPPSEASPSVTTAPFPTDSENGGRIEGGEGGREGDGAYLGGMLQRPLRLADGCTVMVQITEDAVGQGSVDEGDRHLLQRRLRLRVLGVSTLGEGDRLTLAAQVSRMLRLKETDAMAVRAFQAAHADARQNGFGRLFRSPTLFEDMIKTMLLCNCGWGRTLSMNERLCELQAELYGPPLGHPHLLHRALHLRELPIAPETPSPTTHHQIGSANSPAHLKTSGSPAPGSRPVRKLSIMFAESALVGRVAESESADGDAAAFEGERPGADVGEAGKSKEGRGPLEEGNRSACGSGGEGGTEKKLIGGFPTAEELACLDPAWLSAKCGLGYRAARVVRLAADVCSGVVDLRVFEGLEGGPRLSAEHLMMEVLKLPGFGPFAAANVMCCLGEFSVIAADSETARHVRQVHGRADCSISNVDKVVAQVYGSHAPFQFLAYWHEIWLCYERRFGSLSRMPPSEYRLLTGHNMKQTPISPHNDITKTSDNHPLRPRTPRKRASNSKENVDDDVIPKRARPLQRCKVDAATDGREPKRMVESFHDASTSLGTFDMVMVKQDNGGDGSKKGKEGSLGGIVEDGGSNATNVVTRRSQRQLRKRELAQSAL